MVCGSVQCDICTMISFAKIYISMCNKWTPSRIEVWETAKERT